MSRVSDTSSDSNNVDSKTEETQPLKPYLEIKIIRFPILGHTVYTLENYIDILRTISHCVDFYQNKYPNYHDEIEQIWKEEVRFFEDSIMRSPHFDKDKIKELVDNKFKGCFHDKYYLKYMNLMRTVVVYDPNDSRTHSGYENERKHKSMDSHLFNIIFDTMECLFGTLEKLVVLDILKQSSNNRDVFFLVMYDILSRQQWNPRIDIRTTELINRKVSSYVISLPDLITGKTLRKIDLNYIIFSLNRSMTLYEMESDKCDTVKRKEELLRLFLEQKNKFWNRKGFKKFKKGWEKLVEKYDVV